MNTESAGSAHREPRVGVGVIVRKDARVLLLRRRGAHGAGSWSPSGGHLDFGESLEDCAVRETREETGVTVGPVRFRAVTNDVFAAEDRHYLTVWMEAPWVSGAATLRAADEASDVGWYPLDALPDPLFLPFAQLLAGRCYPAP